jgi:hypothetical protein
MKVRWNIEALPDQADREPNALSLSSESVHAGLMKGDQRARIEQGSRRGLNTSSGSLYPSSSVASGGAGWKCDWQITENNRRAEYYQSAAFERG